jgi:hypothetical protein
MTTPAANNKRKDTAQAALCEAVQQAIQSELETIREAARDAVREELAGVRTGIEILMKSSQFQERTNDDLRDELQGIRRELELLRMALQAQEREVYLDITQPESETTQRLEYPQVESDEEEDEGGEDTIEEDNQTDQIPAAEVASREPNNGSPIEEGRPQQQQQRPESPVKRLRVGPGCIVLGLGGGVPRPEGRGPAAATEGRARQL